MVTFVLGPLAGDDPMRSRALEVVQLGQGDASNLIRRVPVRSPGEARARRSDTGLSMIPRQKIALRRG